MIQPFHLAFPVHDLQETLEFYTKILGCTTGRTSDHWIDFNMYGHQVVAHLSPEEAKRSTTNDVDGDQVPVRHFGVVLGMKEWEELAERLKQEKISFIIEPHIRFKGLPGEQATMFFLDPSGNALEFKAFKDMNQLFAT
ncbi:VOC family protein [Fulvivirga sedimenti]|uniref:VOC family protein n=1 Tax=Fulvivirga sedimenti TaxID=2879465 RepID=A0A9X1HVZ4_9BACT|nr:VOC family protein [Fulvivirga sedimenti]MCA6078671.1 VOC family protein [Fulvivirga sedimenti]